MDDAIDRPARLRFGPDRRWSAAGVAGALVALTAAFAGDTDRPGRALLVTAAVLLAATSAADVLFWPRLIVDGTGLRIRSPLARAQLPWAEVTQIRADVSLRHGLRSTTLEIDDGERLFVLGRRALNADPEHAAELIRAFDPRR